MKTFKQNESIFKFPVLSESIAAVCEFYPKGSCQKGAACPFRHVRGDRTIVCKHWLRGLCKKGDQCEFLHEYDMSKMPECYFYSRFSKWLVCCAPAWFWSQSFAILNFAKFLCMVVLYGHKMWYLVLGEVCQLQVFGNKLWWKYLEKREWN